MEYWNSIMAFLNENYVWIFGSTGLLGALVGIWKVFVNKPSIQQSQVISGSGNGYQSAGGIKIKKKGRAK